MSEVRGEVELDLKADRFSKGATEAKRGFKEIETAGTGAFQQVKNKSDEATSSIEKFGKSAKQSTAQAIGNISGLVTGVAGAAFQYKNLEDRSLGVEKAALNEKRAYEQLQKVLKDTSSTTDEIAIATENHRIKQEQHKQMVDNLNESYIQFGLQLGTMGLTIIPNAIKSIGGLVAGHFAGAGAAGVHAAAEGVVTRGIWAQTFAMLSNPLFAIPTAIAIGAAVAIVATNQWGLRDALFGTTEAIKENTKATSSGKDAVGDYGQAVKTGIPYLNAATSSIKEHTKAVKADTDMVKMWKKVNAEALESAMENVKKNERTVNEFQRIFVDNYLKLQEKKKQAMETVKELQQARIHAENIVNRIKNTMFLTVARIMNLGGQEFDKKAEELGFESSAAFRLSLIETERGFNPDAIANLLKVTRAFGQDLTAEELAKAGIRGFNATDRAEQAEVARRLISRGEAKTIAEAQAKHNKSVSAANKAFAAAGQKSLSKKQAGKRRGGHSRFRRDTAGGRWAFFTHFQLPKIISRVMSETGLDEETAQRLAEQATTYGRGGRNYFVPNTFDEAKFRRLAREEAERRAEAPFLPFGGSAFVTERLGITRTEAGKILGDTLTTNDLSGMLAFRERELLASTMV